MKKCTYCGKEYPDDALRCIIDHEPLTGGDTEPSNAGEMPNPTVQTPPLQPDISKASFSDRQMVVFEVVILCAIAFGSSILGSFYYLFDHAAYASSTRSEYAWAAQTFREVSCLALLWYLLMRRGRSFSSLGLIWSWKDLGWAIVLCFASSIAFQVFYQFLVVIGATITNRAVAEDSVEHLLFGGGIFFTTIFIQLINPFFEELIVRAYLMTQVKWLTHSVIWAVVISTVLQTSYHFYQGVPMALSLGASFLIFSLFYARTHRIAPVILAHLYSDVGGTLFYWFRH